MQLRSERSQPYSEPLQEICRAFKECAGSVVALDVVFHKASCLETSRDEFTEPLTAQRKEMAFKSGVATSQDRITD